MADLIDLLAEVSPGLAATMDRGSHFPNHASDQGGGTEDQDQGADRDGESEADDDRRVHQDSFVRAQVSSVTVRCWTSST